MWYESTEKQNTEQSFVDMIFFCQIHNPFFTVTPSTDARFILKHTSDLFSYNSDKLYKHGTITLKET